MQIEIRDVAADAPPLRQRVSEYQPLFDRIEKLQPRGRFVATVPETNIKNARSAVMRWCKYRGISISTSISGKEIEITRKDGGSHDR